MTSETKKCPFCAEEINQDAIKCKHCGEFLNFSTESTDSISNPDTIQTIEHQNFNSAIFVGLLSIVLSFVDIFNDIDDASKVSWRITLYLGLANMWLWIYFRKYIQNFKVSKAIILTNWIIVLNIVMLLLEIIVKALPDSSNSDVWQDTDTLWVLIFLFYIVIAIASIVVYIKAGIVFQKIKNDFVGLLKELGMSVAYLFPIVLLIIMVGEALDNNAVKILGTVIDNISTVIMIMIFIRAKKYVN